MMLQPIEATPIERAESAAITDEEAAALARTRGYAIAIGHPYAETLSALRTWQNREGVALVPLRRLIWSLALENAGTTRGRAARTRAD